MSTFTKFFSPNKYLLADTAFKPSLNIIPSFKKLPGSELSAERKHFNYKLAKIRIRSEHCIGLIKARFAYFKNVRMKLRTAKDLRSIIRLIMCAIIMHIYLLIDPSPTEIKSEINDTEDDSILCDDDNENIYNLDDVSR